MKSTVKIVLPVLCLLLSAPAIAKDLTHRIGLGYNAQFNQTNDINGTPAISLKYGLAPRAVIDLIAGFNGTKNSSGVGALKYMYTIFPETYANFYGLAAFGLVNLNEKSGSEILGGFGGEFFIPGVDSLGISFETGVAVQSVTGTTILKSYGISFINAGMHFYF